MSAITLTKKNAGTTDWRPLEGGTITVDDECAARVVVADAARRPYVDRRTRPGRALRFKARGTAGVHTVTALDADGVELAGVQFTLRPQTTIECSRGPYAELARRLSDWMAIDSENHPFIVDGRIHRFLVSWGRDHTYTLKAMKYFIRDVKSGIEFFLERQHPNGMFWDDCHRNGNRPYPSWFCEALGPGYWGYSKDMEFTFRRIPIEADVEYLYTECVWYVWKASGDDAWMAAQLPKLEKALRYNGSHPTRWSKKHGLVKRAFCMDTWDFTNPLYCSGDHRVLYPRDPRFLFHGDNSGFYASHWRMAEMHEALGNAERAADLRREGEALRRRANEKLFFGNHYGHMIPESLPEKEVYAQVGDERERMSLSTGYTINRGLPDHAMAVKILKEYQRRGAAQKSTSFAEWWSMDPMYTIEQWPSGGPAQGDYVNGAIGLVVAGELAKAAYDHGMEDYGTDILDRIWRLAGRDTGPMAPAYKRLPEKPAEPHAGFRHLDLRPFANVGLRRGAAEGVTAWTDEGENDMRNLPTGRRRFGAIEFDVIEPASNGGRAVVRLDASGVLGAAEVTVPVDALKARSIYFMHTMPHSAAPGAVVGTYDVCYADGATERVHVRNGYEIGLWWGITDQPDTRWHREVVDRRVTRVAWQGPNGQWKNVGLHMTGWNNPHPDVPITAVRMAAVGRAGIMLAAVSLSDEPVCFDAEIRSGGWPESWSYSSLYYAIAEGLAGVEDTGRAFDRAAVSPRWASTESATNHVTLHYPASDGYCSYDYALDRKRRRITLDLTGAFGSAHVHCLLPGAAKAKRVAVDGAELKLKNTRIEKSSYVDFELDGLPSGPITIHY